MREYCRLQLTPPENAIANIGDRLHQMSPSRLEQQGRRYYVAGQKKRQDLAAAVGQGGDRRRPSIADDWYHVMQIFIAANNSPGKGEVVGLVNRDWCRAGDCLADIQFNARTDFGRHLRWNGARIALDEAQLNGHGSEISMFVFVHYCW